MDAAGAHRPGPSGAWGRSPASRGLTRVKWALLKGLGDVPRGVASSPRNRFHRPRRVLVPAAVDMSVISRV